MKYCFILLLFSCSAVHLPDSGQATRVIPNQLQKIDTVGGYFLYEVDAPLTCYTRADQVEQYSSLIFFNDQIATVKIENLYRAGVFMFEYQPLLRQYFVRRGGVSQNESHIKWFFDSLDYKTRENDPKYLTNIYWDNNKVIRYKKIYAKFLVAPLGPLEILVPDTDRFRKDEIKNCCYNNKTMSLEILFIVDVLELQMLE